MHLRLPNLSMRTRLALWSALIIPLLIFLVAFTARGIIVSSLYGDIDGDLDNSATAVIVQIEEAGTAPAPDTLRRVVEQNFANVPLFIRLTDTQGRVLSRYGELPRPVIPNLDKLTLSPPNDPAFQTVKIRGVNSLRVYTVRTLDPSSGQPSGALQVAESLSAVSAAEQRLFVFALSIGIGGTLVTLAATFLIVQRTLRPLERILTRVREVQQQNLHGGLPQESRPPELQELASSLNSMWQRFQGAFENQQSFVATVSHDLRTPLAAIQGQLDVLLMRPELDGQTRNSLHKMLDEVRRLSRLTNQLLLTAQLEARPQLQARVVSLRELAEEVVSGLWPLAQNREMRIEAAADVSVDGDFDLLKEMLLNIVDNAIKYTPPDGSIVFQLRRAGADAFCVVSDNGRGVPADELSRLTDRFFRGAAASGGLHSGAGLGLSIVKQIVELHHGTLSIVSTVGRGTTVTIRLSGASDSPRASESARAPARVPLATQQKLSEMPR